VTAGDPLGIGPEVVVKALASMPSRAGVRIVIHGDETTLAAAAGLAGIDPFWMPFQPGDGAPGLSLVHTPVVVPALARPGPTAPGGRHSYSLLLAAIAACKHPPEHPAHTDAIVTAPIAKEAWSLAGISDPGHTEVLAEKFHSPRSAMLFVGPSLRVILATTHVALRDVPALLTTDRVFNCIDLGAAACRELGLASPRIAVAGLNPHAGEAGMFGDEDDRIIAPAVQRARAAGIDATGPLPGDTVFLAAAKKKFDLVVAMYHDQGLIPVKLLDREQAVNVTAGLRWEGRTIIRTSPAHGTAYDIAGKNIADPGSMRAALELAIKMVQATRA
jgi:4-phospho-D-threonate 3-dehydrogenase / 4-phospho-D-erythronate 3-dehydrogenase